MITMALLHAMSFLSVCSAAQGQMSSKTVLDRDSKGGSRKAQGEDVTGCWQEADGCAVLCRISKIGKDLKSEGTFQPQRTWAVQGR